MKRQYKIVDRVTRKLHSLKSYTLSEVNEEIKRLNDIVQDYRYRKLFVK